MEACVKAAVEAWLADPAIAEADKREIVALVARAQGLEQGRAQPGAAGLHVRNSQSAEAAEAELADRFYRTLEFGTGGMRGVIGAGINRINLYTVGAAAQGLADYVAEQGEGAKRAGVAIAHDSRRMSDAFARRVATVLAASGVRAFLYERLRPTPALSFAIRQLGCTAGVMITASHNPPEYNGLKMYWRDGAQVVPPQDEGILACVNAVGGFGNVRSMSEEDARRGGLLRTIGQEVDEAYLEAIQQSCLCPAACREHGGRMKLVFTSLHGTGGELVPAALARRGFTRVLQVAEQAEPSGDFPTVATPNPEEPAAMEMAISLAKREGAELVIGTDPDADRMGLAVREKNGGYRVLTGNQIAGLLTYYICEQLKRAGRFPGNGVVLTTIVTSEFMKEIARSYGAEVVETLTGFKWIGEKLRHYDEARAAGRPSKAFVFGAEESYGFLPAAFVRDKDAVASAAFVAELAAFAAAEGRTVAEVLDGLYGRYGYYQEGAKSFTMKGKSGAERIAALMEGLRRKPPKAFGGIEVSAVGDFLSGENRDAKTGAVLGRYELPESNVMQFALVDGTKVIARPSGTEPKIKFYILAREPGSDLVAARERAGRKIGHVVEELEERAKGV